MNRLTHVEVMSVPPGKSNRSATLADVAKAAGVSIATASYVLSNREGVSITAATREKVRDAATRLQYRRNALAAALRTGASRRVGIFSPERPHGALADIAFACAEVARSRELSASMLIGPAETLDLSGLDGIILLGIHQQGLPVSLTDGSMPVVEIGSTITGCQVHADDFGGARRAVEHLLSLGHRRIVHFAGPQSHAAYQERLRGFLDGVHEGGLRMDASPVVHSENDLVDVLQGATRPTGLLAYNDRAALVAYRCCRDQGIAIPAGLSIVGFDDEAFSTVVEPPLTSLRVQPELLAGSAFELLERQLERQPVPSQTLVPTTMIVRASTAPR